jgi:hypothetical protein
MFQVTQTSVTRIKKGGLITMIGQEFLRRELGNAALSMQLGLT